MDTFGKLFVVLGVSVCFLNTFLLVATDEFWLPLTVMMWCTVAMLQQVQLSHLRASGGKE